jgi:lipopolysaccharide heptosyltransferase II
MKRILVVNVNWLGDAIMTTPVFKALKERFPGAYVAVMVVERVREVFENNPYIDEIIIFDEKKARRGFFKKIQFIKTLRAKHFDTVFLIHRSFTRALICYFAGIKERIGYRRFKNILLLNKPINAPPPHTHRQDRYLYLLEACGIPIDRSAKVYINKAEKEKFSQFINETRKENKYIVGINPSANWRLKRWPLENFANLGDRLSEELNCAIFLIGAKPDTDAVKVVSEGMKHKPYDFSAKTNIKELAALMENMDLFISADSGPAHLAVAIGIKTIVLFGPTSQHITAPRGKSVKILRKPLECDIPCYKLNCPDNFCMKNISVNDVFLQAKLCLNK